MTETPEPRPEPSLFSRLLGDGRAGVAALAVSVAALVIALAPYASGTDFGSRVKAYLVQNPEVLQEVSNATTETQFGAPVISTREVETQLFIKDGHTAVIGGLVDRQTETGNSGIPLLRSIPLLGIPFRSSHRRTTTTELFILLTPHVIRSDSDLEVMTNQIRNDSQQGGSSLKSLVPSDTVPAKLRQ